MKKTRILSLLLALCMLVSLLPTAMAANRVEVNPLTAESQSIQNVETEAETTETEPEETPVGIGNTPVVNASFDEDVNNALIDNMPQLVDDTVTVTAEEIENPGVDLRLDTEKVNEIDRNTLSPDEIVRVIVVLEDKGLLEQGFSTAEIASNTGKVSSQAQTLAKRQDAAITAINQVVEEPVEAKYRYSVAVNGLAVEVPYGDLPEIKALPNVKTAFVAPRYDAPQDMSDEVANPNMYAAKDTVGAPQTWEKLGYTGAGMRIAIIDSGLDTDHPAFQAAPPLTEDSLTLEEVASVMKSLNAYQEYMSHTSKELKPERLYRSEKVPFGFNYCDDNLELNHDNASAYDHGSHVAGIAAANAVEGSDVVGVAPDAQLLIFKVFGKAGGAFFDDILAALEDSFRLNADAVNLSLGSAAGFVDEDDYTTHIFKQIMDSDMVVAISAGNSFSAAYQNAYGTGLNLTKDPDIGVVGSPGSYVGATTVASLENGYLMSTYFEVGENKLTYHDAASIPFTTLAGQELTYVMVPGYGTAADFEGLDLTGKVAVVKRGTSDPNAPVSFVDKQQNAVNAGAVAVIIYDNVEGSLGYMQDAGLVPNVMITMADGAILEAQATEGVGTMIIHGDDELITVESPEAGLMSTFSSWGVTPDLQLEPDITAPGGNIYSAVDGGGYGTKSGTSMASPAVAGMSALVLQHIRETYDDLFEDEVHTLAEALLMSTAEPVLEVSGIPASPRKQGAGSANVYRAITSQGYLTVNGGTPKVSFGDDDLHTGVYNFSFEINNRSDKALTYFLDGTALTDQVNLAYENIGYYFMSETSRKLDASVTFTAKNGVIPTEYDYNVDGETDLDDVQALLDAVNGLGELKAGYDLTGDGKTDTADAQALYEMILDGFTALNVVEVPANGSVRVYVTVTLTDDDKAYMDKYYENGIYVDGFVRCYAQDEGGVDLSLPYMGFYGDWSDARVFDEGWYTSQDVEYNRYFNIFFTSIAGQDFILGWSPYVDEPYDEFHNVLSPNGDGTLDSIIEIYLSMMRNAKAVRMNIKDAETDNNLFQYAAKYVRKSTYYAAYQLCLPMIFRDYGQMYDFADVKNNDELELSIDAYLDDGDFNVDESYSTPIYIDTEKPVLYTDSIEYIYDAATDTRKLAFDVSDNHAISAVITMTQGNGIYERMAIEDKPGERIHVELDVTDYDASFTIAVCDYGCNESYYNITFFGQENLHAGDFYGYRMAATIPVSETQSVITAVYNGWNSFSDGTQMFQHTAASLDGQPDVYAAEYVDGYIIGIDVHSNIFTMKAGDWTRTYMGKLEVDGITYPALDMAYDYTTGNMYILTDTVTRGHQIGNLLKLDVVTGEVTYIGPVEDDNPKEDQGITLACDNEGVLYTVYAVTGNGRNPGVLCTIDKETGYATWVGQTGMYPLYQQSMTVDHETNKLYWASYQQSGNYGEAGIDYNGLFEVDKETGELTLVGRMMYDDEITGLFKVYHPETPIFPEDASLTGLQLGAEELTVMVGHTAELTCTPLPFYAELSEVTWTSSDETVATVVNGVVTAVGEGQAVITATCGEFNSTCIVTVMDFSGEVRLYNVAKHRWISFDLSDVSQTTVVEDATNFLGGFTNAGYYDGTVIATDYLKGFYRLDAETLQGEQVSTVTSVTPYGYAMNYQDGFMYTMSGPHLYRVNPYTGQTQDMGRIFVQGSPYGGFTIDRSGNAYVIIRSYDGKTTSLCKFPIVDGKPGDTEKFDLLDNPIQMYDCSLTYSEENHGLLWANDSGHLLWIDAADMENVKIADLGIVGNSTLSNGLAMNTCIYVIPTDEPEVNYAPVSSASMESTYTMVKGGTTLVSLSCQPWNAKLEVTYTIDNPRIATVDETGHITGLSAGTTTLRAQVAGLSYELTATVNVIESAGQIYGYMLGNYAYDYGKWIRFNDYDPSTYEIVGSTPGFYQVRAGAYYDGYIYAYCATEQDEDWKRNIVKIDTGDYSRETLCFSEYQIRDMEFDYTTGTMYGVAERVFGNAEKDYALIQIDIHTGEEMLVGSTGHDLVAFTIDDQGRLFGINQNGQLCRIDKETGKASVVGSAGASTMGSVWQCMYFDHNTGNTYWPQPGEGGRLRTIDLETGRSTEVGMIGQMGMQMSAMFTVPEEEISVPATMEPTGVKLEAKSAVTVGSTVTLQGRALPFTVCSMDGTLAWTSSDTSVATVEDGVVTGVTAGTATITATTVNGLSAQCTVTVLDHERRFYAYDQDNTRWISFTKDDPTDYTVEREDAEGESRIFASTLVGDTIYAFDEHMCFYTIDPDTFERTLVSDATKDMTYSYYLSGVGSLDLMMMPIDMSYDEATGKLYLAVVGYRYSETGVKGIQGLVSLFYEVNMTTGEFGRNGNGRPSYQDDTLYVTNLLAENSKLYFVDGFVSGMFRYADLNRWQTVQDALIVEYWGLFHDGRGMIRDEYTGEVYAIYDNDPTPGSNDGGHCRLAHLSLNNPDATFYGDGFIAEGSVLNSLFIR